MLYGDLLLKNAHIVLTDNRVEKMDLLIENGAIKALIKPDQEAVSASKEVDLSGRYVMSGFVNTHTHLFQSLFKGLGRDLPLMDWLAASIRPNAPKLTREDCYYAGLLGGMDSVMSGTTTIMDFMYANENKDCALGAIDAMEDLGIRGILGRGFIDVPLEDENHNRWVESPDDILGQVDRLRSYVSDKPRIGVGIAGSVFWAISGDGFAAIRDYADRENVVVALHASETKDDNIDSMSRFGMRMFPYLESVNLLKPWLTAVHCVDVDQKDIELLKKYNVKVSYNPLSNLILGSGIPPMVAMHRAGLSIGLGTDGAASNDSQDMLEVIKIGALLQKGASQDPTVFNAQDIFNMATLGGAECCGLKEITGSLEVGKKADLLVYNPNRIKSMPVYNVLTSLAYASDQSNIEKVMVDGQWIYDDGEFTNVSKNDVIAWVKLNQQRFNTSIKA